MSLSKSALRAQTGSHIQCLGSWIYGVYTWTIFTVLILSFGGLSLLAGRADRARRMARCIARLMFRLAGMPLSVTGLERLPAPPHVLLANHTSFLDALVLIALLPASPGYTFTTRQEFALQSLLYPLLRSVHTIVLKRHDETHHGANLEVMESALERGENLLIFPEGKFAPEAGLKPFHSGAFVAAAQANVPVVIVGLRGARDALRLGTWLPKRKSITLEIGPTLTPCGTDSDTIHALMAEARAAMIPLTGEAPSPA
jgi:1-acyl-sn-glycerol-3-phosphate acyltransferase